MAGHEYEQEWTKKGPEGHFAQTRPLQTCLVYLWHLWLIIPLF
jgi:hypothetical protein